MNGNEMRGAGEARSAARLLVDARRNGGEHAAMDLRVPDTIEAAYAIQDAGIRLWPGPVAGWKVGAVGEPWRSRLGIERLVGPVFLENLQIAAGGECVVRVFPQGFAAVEAEFVFRIRPGADTGGGGFTPDSAADVVESLHGGVEIASSPNSRINEQGPGAIVADFGNNAGLLVGPAITRWRDGDWARLACSTNIDGTRVGEGTAANVPGGPLTALAFALNHCAARGMPLQAGQHVCTGATTGIHVVHSGQRAEVSFGTHGALRCRIEAAPRR